MTCLGLAGYNDDMSAHEPVASSVHPILEIIARWHACTVGGVLLYCVGVAVFDWSPYAKSRTTNGHQFSLVIERANVLALQAPALCFVGGLAICLVCAYFRATPPERLVNATFVAFFVVFAMLVVLVA